MKDRSQHCSSHQWCLGKLVGSNQPAKRLHPAPQTSCGKAAREVQMNKWCTCYGAPILEACYYSSLEGWGPAKKHNYREDIETTAIVAAPLLCCTHNDCNSSAFYGSTTSKAHKQQQCSKFMTLAIGYCFFRIQNVTRWITCQILEDHFQHPTPGTSTVYLFTEHSALNTVKLFSCNHRKHLSLWPYFCR